MYAHDTHQGDGTRETHRGVPQRTRHPARAPNADPAAHPRSVATHTTSIRKHQRTMGKDPVMNALTRKLAAGVIAAATMLGLAGLGTTTANAADTATLTVSTTDAKFAGKTANAYKMFDAVASGSTDTGDKAVTYTLDASWNGFFTGTDDAASGANCSGDDAAVSTCAYNYVSGLTDTDALTGFARKASNWAQKTGSNITAAKTATVSATATNGKYTASFADLAYGYYLVAVEGAAVANTSGQYATLVSVDSATVETSIKGDLPTVEKKVDGNDSANAQIGQKLTFTLTSTIPDMTAYDSYTFNFKDTLSAGLTFNAITSVKVDGDADALVENTDYTVTKPTAANGNQLTVAMTDFKNKQQANAGKQIVVTYTATLNENAIVGGAGNTNSAKIEYSNNPNTNGTGESEPDTVRTFTYQFTIDKYTGDTYSDTAKRLAGAVFQLKAKDGADYIAFVQENAGNDTTPAVYRVATDDDDAATKVTEFTTPASGKLTLKGLKNGEYLLHEKTAPAGYNPLASDIGVKIEGKDNGTEQTKADVTITYDNEAGASYNQTATDGVIPVKNNAGSTLPGTGGMGTIAFTVAGVLIVALGVAWYVRRERA